MKKNIYLITSIFLCSTLFAQNTKKSANIHVTFKYHSYLADLVEPSITLGAGGNVCCLTNCILYNSNDIVQKKQIWANCSYSYKQEHIFENLPYGEYSIKYLQAIDTIQIFTSSNLYHAIYLNDKPTLKTKPTFIEQMKNNDVMTITVKRYGYDQYNTNPHLKVVLF